MVVVLGDLLMDYSLRLPDMRTQPEDLHEVTYLELGPGGAANVAIMVARLGLEVYCLGEVGDDLFGRILRDSLLDEQINTTYIRVTPGARTPVANVLVDERGEPAYLGYPGSLQLTKVPDAWRTPIQEADALFCDGWAEYDGVPGIILEAFQLAREAGVPLFFDAGPGNPRIDNAWHLEASAMSTVVLVTDREAARVTGESDPLIAAQTLLNKGTKLVVLKRGVAGCLLVDPNGLEIAPGYPVEARDATGAGDSFDGAVIYGYLKGLDLPALGTLANATGAAKVRKLGTGHNMPWPAEIRQVLDRYEDGHQDFDLPA
jgi:sugar/nucleoside kinase (ribokinase family)